MGEEGSKKPKGPAIAEASIDSEISKLEKDTAVYSNIITTTEKDSKKLIKEFDRALSSVRRQAKESISETVRSVRFYFWTVFLFWILGGIGISYALWSLSTAIIVGFVVFWVLVGTVVLWNARNQRNSLQASERILGTNLPKDTASNEEEVGASLSLPQEVSTAQGLSKTIQDALVKVTNAAILLSPKSSDILRLRTLKLKQEHFIDDFAFALSRYKLVLDYTEIQALLTRKFWIYDDDTLWLNDSINEVKKYFLISSSASILKLVYYDSTNQSKPLKQVWEQVCDDPKLRNELASLLIDKGLLEASTANESSVEPLSELLFGIRTKEYTLGLVNIAATEFFDGLTSYKNDVTGDLKGYGIEIKDGLKELTDFMPGSTSPNLWREKILDIAATIIEQDPLVVKLLVRESQGDSGRLGAWRRIITLNNSESEIEKQKGIHLLEQLATVLSIKRIPKPFIEFRDDAFLKHLALILASSQESISVSKVETELRLLETQILRVKRNVEATINRYKLGFADLDFFDEFVPHDVHSAEKDIVSKASTKCDVDPRVFEMLYYSLIVPELADSLFVKMKGTSMENSQLGIVASFLIAKKFIPSTQFKRHLETLLRTQNSFDINQFVQLFYSYERLFRSSSALYDFLADNRILGKASRPDIGMILKLCPPDGKQTFENCLVDISESLSTDTIESHSLSASEKKDVAYAATALSLKSQNELSYKQLCMQIAGRRLAPRILYEYANVDKIDLDLTLAKATERALNTSPENERHFAGFVAQLEAGMLHLRIGNLLEVQISEATERIVSWENSELRQADVQFIESVKVLFNEQINEDIVKEFLTQQIISAYIITDPTNNPLIRLLDERDSIKKAQDSLSMDESFKNLVLTRKGSGKGTRIGLVPFGMPFEDFTKKFDTVLQEAVKIFNKTHPDDKVPDPLPCYVLRIFPSEYGLKEIMTTSSKEARPVLLVKDLMEESMSSTTELKLLSLVQSTKTGYEGFKSVIQALVDHERSSIATLLGGRIDSFLSSSPELKRWFQGKKLDKVLLTLYTSEKLSELCLRIAKETDSTAEKSKSNVLKSMPQFGDITRKELESVVELTYERLKDIGIGLST